MKGGGEAFGAVIAGEEGLYGFLLGVVERRDEAVAPFQPAVPHREHDEGDQIAVAVPREIIPGRRVEVLHVASAHEEVHGLEGVAEAGRFLEAEFLGCLTHPRLEVGEKFGGFARKQLAYLPDPLQVSFPGNLPGAGAGAAADMVVHTGRLALAHGYAATQRKEPFYEFEIGVYRLGAGKWAEILGTVVDDPAGLENAREFLVRDPDGRVGFPVLQVDIVFGSMFLYQVVFDEEGVVFAPRQDPFDIFHARDEMPRLYVFLSRKIGKQTVFQYLGFAHVDDMAFEIAHYVDAGRIGSLPHQGAEAGVLFGRGREPRRFVLFFGEAGRLVFFVVHTYTDSMEFSSVREAGDAAGAADAGMVFKFCPSCASPRISFLEGKKWVCPDCGFEYFHNVATSATVIIDVEGSIVLLKRARDPRRGFWTLPGGFVEPAERAEDAAMRECREELGWAPTWMEFVVTFPNTYRYKDIPYATCDLYFYTWASAVDVASFVADIGEVAEVASFPAETIPWNEIAFDSARSALRAYVQARGNGLSLGRQIRSI